MFGTDVGVVHAAGFIYRQLYHLFGAGSKTDLTLGRLLTATDDKFYRRTYFAQVNSQPGQYPGGYPFGLPHQPEEYVLRTNIVMVKSLGFFLG
jgi:hypothetical protein